jgi:hypothetical protein
VLYILYIPYIPYPSFCTLFLDDLFVNLVSLALLLDPELIDRVPPATGAKVHPGHQALTLQGGDS